MKKFDHLPENLTIATFGDNELLNFLPCKMIALSQDHKAISEVTIKLLFDSLHNKNYQPGTTVIPRRLIYRGSLSRKSIAKKSI